MSDEEKVPPAAFREAVAREAERRGMTLAEFEAHLDKWAEFDRMNTEFMQARGVKVRGMNSAAHLAQTGQTTSAARAGGGGSTAKARKAEKAVAAQEAARIWDSLTTIPEHNRAAVVAHRMGVSEPTARTYLREAGRKAKGR